MNEDFIFIFDKRLEEYVDGFTGDSSIKSLIEYAITEMLIRYDGEIIYTEKELEKYMFYRYDVDNIMKLLVFSEDSVKRYNKYIKYIKDGKTIVFLQNVNQNIAIISFFSSLKKMSNNQYLVIEQNGKIRSASFED